MVSYLVMLELLENLKSGMREVAVNIIGDDANQS